MYAHHHVRRSLTVRLEDPSEMFEWETPTGRIRVQTIIFDEHGHETSAVTFRGWAIKRDGSDGVIQRSCSVSLRDVPSEVILYALATLRNIKMEGPRAVE